MSAESEAATVNGTEENETPREKVLSAKIKALEDDRIKFLDIVRCKIQKLEGDLQVKCH